MKKQKVKKNESSTKKTPAPRQRKKAKTGNQVEELFGVHVISNADIRNHFGTSAEEPDGESEN